MENVSTVDPYEAVLADLRLKRLQIDNTITLLEALRSGSVAMPNLSGSTEASSQPKEDGNRPELGPGAFLGMTIHDAAKKLLATRRRQMPTIEIVQELERGGLVLTSADKLNTVGSVLLRRFNTVGDIVRVTRGIWGLQEWYPGRKFAASKAKGEDNSKGTEAEREGPEVGNVGDTALPQPPAETDRPRADTEGWPKFVDPLHRVRT